MALPMFKKLLVPAFVVSVVLSVPIRILFPPVLTVSEPTEVPITVLLVRPAKPYATRLKWRDRDEVEQQSLLLSRPETVIAVVLRGEAEAGPDQKRSTTRPRARATRRRAQALEK
jgi:hypothetical protein